MNKVDLSIIIVAYNSEDTIVGCLNSIIDTIKKNSYEVIISDNSKNDVLGKVISDNFSGKKNIYYIHNDENLGFSKGNNIGIRQAKGVFVLFLNPDTKVYENTIDGMIEFMIKNPSCGASTCYVQLPDGKLDDSSHRGFPTPIRALSHFSGFAKLFPKNKIFGGYNLTYLDLTRTHEIESLAGSFMLVPKAIGDVLKWWDEDYFFYGEDIDFCYRIKMAGYKIYFVPDFSVLHMKGISSGIKSISKDVTKASQATKKLATEHRFLAMEIFYDKHYKDKYPGLITSLVMLGIGLKKKFATLR